MSIEIKYFYTQHHKVIPNIIIKWAINATLFFAKKMTRAQSAN